jgi:two-component system chemotaxis response regulator CheB
LLRSLPRELRTPIVVTQHMPALFTMLLAQRLERESGRPCVEATDGMKVEPGHVYIAPGDYHLVVEPSDHGLRLRINQGPPEHHCRPSANPMFRSVAHHVGSKAVAIVLTGMGEDGASGTVAIRNRGGRVLVQDEASSVVWGMPGAAVAAGAVHAVLPIPEIAQRLATFELVPV